MRYEFSARVRRGVRASHVQGCSVTLVRFFYFAQKRIEQNLPYRICFGEVNVFLFVFGRDKKSVRVLTQSGPAGRPGPDGNRPISDGAV